MIRQTVINKILEQVKELSDDNLEFLDGHPPSIDLIISIYRFFQETAEAKMDILDNIPFPRNKPNQPFGFKPLEKVIDKNKAIKNLENLAKKGLK